MGSERETNGGEWEASGKQGDAMLPSDTQVLPNDKQVLPNDKQVLPNGKRTLAVRSSPQAPTQGTTVAGGGFQSSAPILIHARRMSVKHRGVSDSFVWCDWICPEGVKFPQIP